MPAGVPILRPGEMYFTNNRLYIGTTVGNTEAQLKSEKDMPLGYAGLDANLRVPRPEVGDLDAETYAGDGGGNGQTGS